jgi:hypothetical protein
MLLKTERASQKSPYPQFNIWTASLLMEEPAAPLIPASSQRTVPLAQAVIVQAAANTNIRVNKIGRMTLNGTGIKRGSAWLQLQKWRE